jgi:sec-independent protein translocase protein TatA
MSVLFSDKRLFDESIVLYYCALVAFNFEIGFNNTNWRRQDMFGMGGQELLLILFAVLLFFGPQKLPELMKGLGKGMKEFKKAQADFEDEINKAVDAPLPKIQHTETSVGSDNQAKNS